MRRNRRNRIGRNRNNNNRRIVRRINNNNNKTNKKLKNINKRINEINRNISKNQKPIRRLTPGTFGILRNTTGFGPFPNFFKSVKNYIHTLMNPELAISGQFLCKQPSFINIPTASVTFKEVITFKASNNGYFSAIWVPNFLSTRISLNKHLTNNDAPYKGYSHFYFTNDDDGSIWNLHTSFLPDIDLSKYRLVSAKCVCNFNSPIIEKSGMFYTCALYNDLPVYLIEEANLSENYPVPVNSLDYDFNSLCDIENIQNGLWAKEASVSNGRAKISNLALPSDPTDHTFFPMSHYYSIEPKHDDSLQEGIYKATSTDGGHLSYIYTGNNLLSSSNNSSSLIFTIYYNFEVIATQTTAPFLRSKKGDKILNKVLLDAKEIINEMVSDINTSRVSMDPGNTYKDAQQIAKEVMNAVTGKNVGKQGMKFATLSGDL